MHEAVVKLRCPHTVHSLVHAPPSTEPAALPEETCHGTQLPHDRPGLSNSGSIPPRHEHLPADEASPIHQARPSLQDLQVLRYLACSVPSAESLRTTTGSS